MRYKYNRTTVNIMSDNNLGIIASTKRPVKIEDTSSYYIIKPLPESLKGRKDNGVYLHMELKWIEATLSKETKLQIAQALGL